MSFEAWLLRPKPRWEQNLEYCSDSLFYELDMTKEELLVILKKLEEHHIID